MDGPPAQSLGVEPVDPRIMNLPPRSKTASVLTRPLLRRVLTSATIIMLGTLAVYVTEMADDATADSSTGNSPFSPIGSIDRSEPVSDSMSGHDSTISSVFTLFSRAASHSSGKLVTRRDTTMTFTTFVLFDMFNALTCRSESKSVLSGELSLFGNKMFNYAVAGSLMGQLCVIYLPFLQRVFQTEAIGIQDIVTLIALASTVFWVDEARKWWQKKRRREGLGRRYARNV